MGSMAGLIMVSGFAGDRHNWFRLLSRRAIVHRIGSVLMSSERKSAIAKLALAACFGVSSFFLAYPVYVIRPFRHQGAGELALALEALRYRPVVMSLCVLTAAAA